MADETFRAGLRAHYFALQARYWAAPRGSRAFWDYERALTATTRLHCTLYGEPVQPVHQAGPKPRARPTETLEPPAP